MINALMIKRAVSDRNWRRKKGKEEFFLEMIISRPLTITQVIFVFLFERTSEINEERRSYRESIFILYNGILFRILRLAII